MIHVIAIITAKPGKRDEVLGHFRANMPAVHAEAGCIEYGPAIDAEGGPGAKYGADTFVVVEKWESLDHLKAEGACRFAAHAGLRRQVARPPRQSRDPRPLPRHIARASTGIHKTRRITRYFLYRRLWLSTSVYGIMMGR